MEVRKELNKDITIKVLYSNWLQAWEESGQVDDGVAIVLQVAICKILCTSKCIPCKVKRKRCISSCNDKFVNVKEI